MPFEAASDVRVARLVGIESEMRLGYAALHQLLLPFLDRGGVASTPTATRIRAAFGLSEGAAPDPFMVALATLTLLANVAAERPLLCVIDDAQWIDDESATAVAFVARRLHAEAVGIVLAVREPSGRPTAFEGLKDLHVGALAAADARELC